MMNVPVWVLGVGSLWVLGVTGVRAGEAGAPAGAPARPDPFMGQYGGNYRPTAGAGATATGYVMGRKDGYGIVVTTGPLRAALAAPAAAAGETYLEFGAKPVDGRLSFAGTVAGTAWAGTCDGNTLVCRGDGPGGGTLDLAYTVPRSPTLELPPPPGAIVLLGRDSARTDLAQRWTNAQWPVLADGSVQVGKGSNYTTDPIGDMQLHLEFLTPYEPAESAQTRGNSGVYIQDRYEIQILDSFGLRPGAGDCAAIYRVRPPDVNVTAPPLVWQTYDISFRAATFREDGTWASEPEVTVLHNGVKVHDRVRLTAPTGAGRERHKDKPHVPSDKLQLQEHGHPVRFRNVWYTKLE